MPLITRMMLQNFKKFSELDLCFSTDRNILVGDNESGKSTILLALDLVLSGSQHRMETLGVESLLPQLRSDAFWKESAAPICYPC